MGKNMEVTMIFMVTAILVLMISSANAAGIPEMSPSPAPASPPVNLTHLFGVAGPFTTFLSLLESTQVIETFQNQVNNSQQGITIFVPQDKAFSSLKNPSLANLTKEQLKSLMLYHALPQYYSLAGFKNLSETNPVDTFAGGQYTLNFTDVSGSPYIDSGWSKTKVSSSVYSTEPVAVYQVDRVLLPEAIFGAPPPPPPPAPAPAPDSTPVSDGSAPSASVGNGSSAKSPKSSDSSFSSPSSNHGSLSSLVLALAGGYMIML